MTKIKFLSIIFLLSLIISCKANTGNNYAITDGERDIIINKVIKCFEKAESSIKLIPAPNPDDAPLGPDPDPKKCICKGTGTIVHGDGHTTKCPFHPVELMFHKMERQK